MFLNFVGVSDIEVNEIGLLFCKSVVLSLNCDVYDIVEVKESK